MTHTTTTAGVTVRPAVPADAPAIAAVKAASATAAYEPLFGAAAVQPWLQRRASNDFITSRIPAGDQDALFLVAHRDSQLVGAGLIRREEAGAYLADVYCDPPGAGAGRALVTALLAHADSLSWGPVRCFVLDGNTAAVRFFTRAGFTVMSRQENAELAGDLLEMRRGAR